MLIEEACLPWDPIPEEANKEWQVNVVHLEETPTHPQEDLSLVIAAAWGEDTGKEASRGAWRVSFRRVYAFRKRLFRDAGNLPLTRPNQKKATWEMFPSRYLEESSAPNGILLHYRERVHHFVILTGVDNVYEFIATAWTSEPLPASWAWPFALFPLPYEE